MLHIKTHPVIHLTESDAEDVSAYYDLICHRIRQTEHRYQNGEVCSLINAFLLRVVGIMDCRLDFTETVSSVHGDQLVEKFVWMVNEDCGRNRLVEYYADRLNITPKYLSTLVRNTLGRTPHRCNQSGDYEGDRAPPALLHRQHQADFRSPELSQHLFLRQVLQATLRHDPKQLSQEIS